MSESHETALDFDAMMKQETLQADVRFKADHANAKVMVANAALSSINFLKMNTIVEKEPIARFGFGIVSYMQLL